MTSSSTTTQRVTYSNHSLIKPKDPLQMIETLLKSAHSILQEIKPYEYESPLSKQDLHFITQSPSLHTNNNIIDNNNYFESICSQILFSTPSKSNIALLSPEFQCKLKLIENKMNYIDKQLQTESCAFVKNLFFSSKSGYNIQSKETKVLINKAIQYFPKKHLKEMFNISTKSIRRWQVKGVEKKKGAGRRKMDPTMEEQLVQWYNNECVNGNCNITASMIKSKAKQFSKVKKFKASKGWFNNFKRSYNIILKNRKYYKHLD